ncbi:hypothetical protein [uncultured Aquimarina sp.]|uniref:hypothetical protein n=1 Tax=uncultured Aquimarina sp. TaxID=575652 RepID=UPI002626C9D8|nr:hypothetical protein [uncultured Aquimarina sp.]
MGTQINNPDNLLDVVKVQCVQKGYQEYDYEEFITYKFLIENKSNKDIRAIKGNIVFTNLFGDKINTLSFVYDDPIKSGRKNNYNATTDYNQFIEEDRALKNKDLKDLKIIWEPLKVIFSDGTTLE